jgi:hypothetical protein
MAFLRSGGLFPLTLKQFPWPTSTRDDTSREQAGGQVVVCNADEHDARLRAFPPKAVLGPTFTSGSGERILRGWSGPLTGLRLVLLVGRPSTGVTTRSLNGDREPVLKARA